MTQQPITMKKKNLVTYESKIKHLFKKERKKKIVETEDTLREKPQSITTK